MFGLRGIAAKIFGSSNDRARSPSTAAGSTRSTRWSPSSPPSPTRRCAARTAMFRERAGRRQEPRRPPGARLRHGARGRQAHPGPAPLRRAADRRHGAARGPHRRNEDRRRQDAGRHASRLSQRAGRQGRACRHRQRLPRQRDAGWMGQIYGFLGLTTGVIVHGLSDERAPRRPMPATSPTPPTTSWASTTCATT